MFKKINRKDCLALYPKFPQSDHAQDFYYFPRVYNKYILSLTAKTAKSYGKSLSYEISHFMQNLGADPLIFLGDSKTPWLFQENEYPPAKDAGKYLKDKKLGKKFNGGLVINEGELPIFINHLFWLSRCNAAFPVVHFSDTKQKFLGSICQYGNLHFYTLHKKTDALLNAFIDKTSFINPDEGKCREQFSKTSGIKGRRTIR